MKDVRSIRTAYFLLFFLKVLCGGVAFTSDFMMICCSCASLCWSLPAQLYAKCFSKIQWGKTEIQMPPTKSVAIIEMFRIV